MPDVTLEPPRRIRLSRAKGWRMPIDTRKVDRSTRWGNPFVVARAGPPAPGADAAFTVATAAEAVSRFEVWLGGQPAWQAEARATLRGRHLACWCALDAPCHADVWLRVVNGPDARP